MTARTDLLVALAAAGGVGVLAYMIMRGIKLPASFTGPAMTPMLMFPVTGTPQGPPSTRILLSNQPQVAGPQNIQRTKTEQEFARAIGEPIPPGGVGGAVVFGPGGATSLPVQFVRGTTQLDVRPFQ